MSYLFLNHLLINTYICRKNEQKYEVGLLIQELSFGNKICFRSFLLKVFLSVLQKERSTLNLLNALFILNPKFYNLNFPSIPTQSWLVVLS